MGRKRIFSLAAFLLLLAIEIVIGLCVHDRFVRPYGGDVLVVILLYFLCRIFLLEKPAYLSLWIFLFAVLVEVTQIIPLVDLLGIQSRLIRVIMGTSFAWGDLLAYGAGTVVTLVLDWNREKRGE